MVPLRDRWFVYWCVTFCVLLCLGGAVWGALAGDWSAPVVLLPAAWFTGRFIGRPAAASLMSHPDY